MEILSCQEKDLSVMAKKLQEFATWTEYKIARGLKFGGLSSIQD
jgi:hypothetical protein